MSRFIGEPEDFRLAGEPGRVLVVRDLLDQLGVKNCSRADQEQSVGRWLNDNEPHKVLAASLRRHGFLADGENVSNDLSNEPRRTGPDGAGSAASASGRNPHDPGRGRTRRHRPGPGSSVS